MYPIIRFYHFFKLLGTLCPMTMPKSNHYIHLLLNRKITKNSKNFLILSVLKQYKVF